MKHARLPPVLKARWLVPSLLLLGLVAGVGHVMMGDRASAKSGPAKAQPWVDLVSSQLVDLPHVIEAQGHVIPLNEVEVRAQMEGVVAALHFREGQEVMAGQLLFELDPGQTPALVRQAKAKLAQITAELTDARRNHARSRELVTSKYISPSALDTVASKVEMLEAQQQAARAEIESSQVMAGYTRIVAPISGRVGSTPVRRGTLVSPSDSTSLVRIVQIDPIAVEFNLPEGELAGLVQALRDQEASVSAYAGKNQARGEIIFTDNSIDPATGTIRLRARFENAGEHLWPGAYVNLRVQAGLRRNSVVLPPQAVIEGPEGHFVYQVDDAGKVSTRAVTFTGLQDGRAVVTGLPAGQKVVSEGNQVIRDGTIVRVRTVSGSQANP